MRVSPRCLSDNSSQKMYIMMEARLVALFKSDSEYTILDKWVYSTDTTPLCPSGDTRLFTPLWNHCLFKSSMWEYESPDAEGSLRDDRGRLSLSFMMHCCVWGCIRLEIDRYIGLLKFCLIFKHFTIIGYWFCKNDIFFFCIIYFF